MSNFLKIRELDAYLEWRIERPERMNGLGPTIAAELARALAELKAKAQMPRVLVLTATPVAKGSSRTWIAGGDLKELTEIQSAEAARAYATTLSGFSAGLEELPCPVIVAVDGAAIGGGVELALAGDLRIATAASSFEFRQLKVGLATGYGGARKLVELIGLGRAQGLLYRSAIIPASEALALGLVHEVARDDRELEARCHEIAGQLAMLSPCALAAQKRMFWHAARSHPGAARAAEADLFAHVWRNPEHQRYLEAFQRGRK